MNTHFTKEYTEPQSSNEVTLLAPSHIAELISMELTCGLMLGPLLFILTLKSPGNPSRRLESCCFRLEKQQKVPKLESRALHSSPTSVTYTSFLILGH